MSQRHVSIPNEMCHRPPTSAPPYTGLPPVPINATEVEMIGKLEAYVMVLLQDVYGPSDAGNRNSYGAGLSISPFAKASLVSERGGVSPSVSPMGFNVELMPVMIPSSAAVKPLPKSRGSLSGSPRNSPKSGSKDDKNSDGRDATEVTTPAVGGDVNEEARPESKMDSRRRLETPPVNSMGRLMSESALSDDKRPVEEAEFQEHRVKLRQLAVESKASQKDMVEKAHNGHAKRSIRRKARLLEKRRTSLLLMGSDEGFDDLKDGDDAS